MSDNTQTSTSVVLTTGNEIDSTGKWFAGILFVLFIVIPLLLLIGYWPDRLPKTDNGAVYRNELFNVCLLDELNHCDSCVTTSNTSGKDTVYVRNVVQKSLGAVTNTDSATAAKRRTDSARLGDSMLKTRILTTYSKACCINTIKLNTLVLILVTLAGFLGTMIHTASSFANFVGSEKFKKSWTLWYVVKPFTGAALALIFYFVFRAGFLNFNDTSNINLFGLITLAALAGLFTDKATLKLQEVFEVIFNPKDHRPDKLDKNEVNVKITGIKPETLLANVDNQLIISGEGLDQRKFVVKIDEEEIKNPVIKGDSISFTYKLPADLEKSEFTLSVFDDQGKEIFNKKLIKGSDSGVLTGNTSTDTDVSSIDDNQENFGDADAPDDANTPQE
jgi:hypothetical protein